MSFSYLPWQLYVLMTIGGAIFLLWHSIVSAKKYPKIFMASLISVSIGGILAGTIKILETMMIMEKYVESLKLITLFWAFLIIILFIVAGYTKAKSDPQKKKVLFTLISILIITVLTCAALIIPEIIAKN